MFNNNGVKLRDEMIEIHEDTPELFSVDFLNHVWEQLNFDFF